MAHTQVRVMVVDDQMPFRLAARAVVADVPDFELVTEASSGEEALTKAGDAAPDLILMDINMPGMSGIEATRHIVAAQPSVVVVLCSTYQLFELPQDAKTSGARAYVNKEDLGADLLRRLWEGRDTGDGFLLSSP